MDPLLRRFSVRWITNYEVTDAEQTAAPILGILNQLRSNQWLVLFRSFNEDRTGYFPFRKREIFTRLSDGSPQAMAAESLSLVPEQGAQTVIKRIWRFSSVLEGERTTLSRYVHVDENGSLLGIGVAREEEEFSLQKSDGSGNEPQEHAVRRYEMLAEELAPEVQFFRADHPELIEAPKSPPKRREQPPSLIVPVYYATDRQRSCKSTTTNVQYTDERAANEKLSLGVCRVSVPRTHQLGKVERPPFWKIWARPNPQDHMMLLSAVELADKEYWQEFGGVIAKSPGRDAFLFVHGYNVSFTTAALRTAQLATDLSFTGGPLMFSWPSKGRIGGYLADEGSIEWSRPHLRAFIEQTCANSNANSIHLIAHSMGSRALVAVVEALRASLLPNGALKQLIFAAPDVDSGIFRQAAKTLYECCTRVTLYASDKDRALKASKKLHEFSRAGEAGEGLLVLSGVDTIDASLVDTDFLGHSGFAEDRPLMQDVYSLVQNGLSPKQRFGLEEHSSDFGTYWSFKP